MRDIVKRFPGVVANDRVTFEVEPGEIHGLLGENGAGKTTLMNVLSGLYHPDAGEIYLHGQRVHFESPRDALAAGVGMVHQHFMLIPRFTVAENLTLGAEVRRRGLLDRAAAEALVAELSQKYGLRVDPRAKVEDISVGTQQRVEILKALYRGARVIILDEPTSVLTPQEVEELYHTLTALREAGHTLVFISHKLNEVLRITDRVTVLRDGRVVGTRPTAETTAGELARMMVGREVLLRVEKTPQTPGEVVLSVEGLSAVDGRGLPALRGVTFEAHAGEIVGIAGIEGNGQSQLVEVLTGLRRPVGGRIRLNGRPVTELPVSERFRHGLAHIPEDRHGRGLILDFSVAENAVLGFQDDRPFAEGLRLNRRRVLEFARQLMQAFDVRAPDATVLTGALSGGNQQKLILAREFARQPRLLIAAQPTRGLDVGATEFIHQQLLRERARGTAVLLVSLELSEIMGLSDRILVLYEGRLIGECWPETVTEAELGLMMAGGRRND
ncbi:MAG: ABC transporter ATP-binding protein [Anaerolineae bacterium]